MFLVSDGQIMSGVDVEDKYGIYGIYNRFVVAGIDWSGGGFSRNMRLNHEQSTAVNFASGQYIIAHNTFEGVKTDNKAHIAIRGHSGAGGVGVVDVEEVLVHDNIFPRDGGIGYSGLSVASANSTASDIQDVLVERNRAEVYGFSFVENRVGRRVTVRNNVVRLLSRTQMYSRDNCINYGCDNQELGWLRDNHVVNNSIIAELSGTHAIDSSETAFDDIAFVCKNNVYWSNASPTGLACKPGTGGTASNNASRHDFESGTNNVKLTVPPFSNAGNASADSGHISQWSIHPTDGASLIDAGEELNAVLYDYRFRPRDSDNAGNVDIGAIKNPQESTVNPAIRRSGRWRFW
jgi:hypothetical protein